MLVPSNMLSRVFAPLASLHPSQAGVSRRTVKRYGSFCFDCFACTYLLIILPRRSQAG